MEIIKNGFTNSIGWNLGKKFRSSHLLDPLISTPINGTKTKNNNERKKIKIENFKSISCFKEDKVKITITPRKIKTKCLKKKE